MADEGFKRKLAAILSADVEGSGGSCASSRSGKGNLRTKMA